MQLRPNTMTECKEGLSGYGSRGRRRRRKFDSIALFGVLGALLVGLSHVGIVYAAPVAQADTATLPAVVASPSPTLTSVSSTNTASISASSQSSSASTTTTVPGTVVTDSPLVRTRSVSSDSALSSGSRNQSASIGSATQSISTTVSSTIETKTLLPSPTSNDNDGPATTQQEQTYNSLVNFYFLILAGAIAFAILGFWYWRRRRRGKTTRDQRRGLEALRRDLELGRLRRGILGVGRRGNTGGEELPT
jgi:uncharacterized iron-regulated membrane protein